MDNHGFQTNAQVTQKPPNIFKAFVYAFIPPRYDQLIKVKTGSMIGFVILLTLIGALIEMAAFGLRYSGEFTEEFPDAVIRDGKLYIDDDYLMNTHSSYVFVTDDVDEFSYEDVKALSNSGYRQVMLIGRDKIALMRYQEYREIHFADVAVYGEEIVIKDIVMPFLIIVIALVFVFFFVGSALWYFLCSAILLVVGLILAQIFKNNLGAGQLYRIAVYSRVIGYVAATLVNAFSSMHSSIPMFYRALITVLVMIAAIRFMPQKGNPSYGSYHG